MATTKNKKAKGVVDGTVKSSKTIDEKAEHKSFFNTRNIVIIIITSLLSIALVALTIIFILDMNWDKFFANVGSGLQHELGWLWFSLLVLFMVVTIAYNYIPIWIRLREMGVKVRAWEYFLFSLSISFLRGVTPSNFIYDPYTVFWLKTQGVSTSKATSIMFSNALIWQAAVLIIHIPSFILVMMQADTIIACSTWGIGIIVLMSVGLAIDIIGCLVMVLLCFSKKTHFIMSSVFNWFKKKLHLKYHTKAEIEEKYKNRATLKRDVIGFYKNKLDTIMIICILTGFELIVYFMFNDALMLINPVNNPFTFDPLGVFNGVNMTFNANRINILPSYGLGLEAMLRDVIHAVGNVQPWPEGSKDAAQFVNQGMFLWRTFFTYFPTLLGLFGFIGMTAFQIRSYKKKKGGFIEAKYE